MNEYDEGMEGTDLLKDLRRQLKEQSAKNKELEQELTGIRTEKRQTSVSTKLAKSGYPADVAKFVPDDMELDQLDHWLEEHGSLFQRSAEAVEAEEAEKPQPQEVAEAARINNLADASIPVDKLQDFERQIGEAQSDEQVQQIINEAKKFVL
jgi:DNA-binding PucR family transcriptional regulator